MGPYVFSLLRRAVYEARQLNQYRLVRKLGSGGMGEVYLAEHSLLKRPCALKLIRPEGAGDAVNLERFEREVRTTARLSHPNIIEIFDYGRTEEGTFYYVMEYLPGLTLDDLVSRHGPLPAGRVIYLLRQACEALSEGARGRPGSSRYQAGQPVRRAPRPAFRPDQGSRLRPGEGCVRRRARQPRAAGQDGRHAPVHVAGASPGRGQRSTHGATFTRRVPSPTPC